MWLWIIVAAGAVLCVAYCVAESVKRSRRAMAERKAADAEREETDSGKTV